MLKLSSLHILSKALKILFLLFNIVIESSMQANSSKIACFSFSTPKFLTTSTANDYLLSI